MMAAGPRGKLGRRARSALQRCARSRHDRRSPRPSIARLARSRRRTCGRSARRIDHRSCAASRRTDRDHGEGRLANAPPVRFATSDRSRPAGAQARTMACRPTRRRVRSRRPSRTRDRRSTSASAPRFHVALRPGASSTTATVTLSCPPRRSAARTSAVATSPADAPSGSAEISSPSSSAVAA